VSDPSSGHNRWHPGIAPLAEVDSGEKFKVDLRDGLDRQITPSSTSADVASMDMRRGHPLSGPFYVRGSQPGDLLAIHFHEIDDFGFGFTCVRPGVGVLGDLISEPFVARWQLKDGVATSVDVAGVEVAARPFLGVVGVAPSTQQLEEYNRRERELESRGAVVPLPDAVAAIPSNELIASNGLRTVPPRENGGNIDAKYLGPGSTLYLRVEVPGALVSFGDPHFAQGNGEVCSQAIEMPASAIVSCDIVREPPMAWRQAAPFARVLGGNNEPGERLMFMGIPVDSEGRNHSMDLNLAARNALQAAHRFLVDDVGLTVPQAYVVCSVAVDLVILQAVNRPNASVGALIDEWVIRGVDAVAARKER
jgi:formamidase